MTYDVDELYEHVVMEHSRNPRNLMKLDSANRSADGFNPFCGDKITLYIEVDEQDVIKDVGIDATGCAISKASASSDAMCLASARGNGASVSRFSSVSPWTYSIAMNDLPSASPIS